MESGRLTRMSQNVVIVGGGAMGSSTAYHLMRADPTLSVVVVERDSSYARASTILSDGNVRIQFNLEENIRMSQYALEVLRTFDDDMATGTFRPEVGARHQGNLFLADEEGKSDALRGIETQRNLGCEVAWLSGEEINPPFPRLASGRDRRWQLRPGGRVGRSQRRAARLSEQGGRVGGAIPRRRGSRVTE